MTLMVPVGALAMLMLGAFGAWRRRRHLLFRVGQGRLPVKPPRWTASRKLAAVELAARLGLDVAAKQLEVPVAELAAWRVAVQEHGRGGVRVKTIQRTQKRNVIKHRRRREGRAVA